jgi:hypothetical protein
MNIKKHKITSAGRLKGGKVVLELRRWRGQMRTEAQITELERLRKIAFPKLYASN